MQICLKIDLKFKSFIETKKNCRVELICCMNIKELENQHITLIKTKKELKNQHITLINKKGVEKIAYNSD
jgi:hypothetical protein